MLHHGTPGAAVVYPSAVDAAARHGLRLVTYSRPGYGRSTAKPGRTVGDAAGDVAAILDSVGAGPFVTIGWSGGGPHALACATLAERCLGAALIGGVAPYGVPGLDWMAGMGKENVAEFNAALAGEPALTEFLREAEAWLATIKAADLAAALGDLVPDVDIAALNGLYGDYSPSPSEYRYRPASMAGATTTWPSSTTGVSARLRCTMSIWQGDKDRMVPHSHGEWLAAHISARGCTGVPAKDTCRCSSTTSTTSSRTW